MSLLSLDHAASLPDADPVKKGFLARIYGALYRARMARVEALLAQYRSLLDEVKTEAKGRPYPFGLD